MTNFNWTRFMVVKQSDPPFDVVLGCGDAASYGLI